MKNAFNYFFIFLFAAALSSCCASKKTDKEKNFDLKIGKIYAWVNLMPGSKAKFHLKGNLDISGDIQVPPDSITISEILIFQNEKLIYNFVPVTAFERREKVHVQSISFSEPEGGILKVMPDTDYPVNIQIFILHSGKKLALDLNDIKVEKVY